MMEVIEMRVEDLRPYENNPRCNEDAIEPVAQSIKEFGFKVPIVVDKNNVIVTGHTRLAAAKKLGLKTVPVIVADDLTDAQIKAFRIADNKVAEQADWDFEKLQKEILEMNDYDWSKFGFGKFELDVIFDTVFEMPTANNATNNKASSIPKVGRIKCPCCDKYFDFQQGMIRGD